MKEKVGWTSVSLDASSDRKTGPEIYIKCNTELFA